MLLFSTEFYRTRQLSSWFPSLFILSSSLYHKTLTAISFHCSTFWCDQINNNQMCWYFTPRAVCCLARERVWRAANILCARAFVIAAARQKAKKLGSLKGWSMEWMGWKIQLPQHSRGQPASCCGYVTGFSFINNHLGASVRMQWFCLVVLGAGSAMRG